MSDEIQFGDIQQAEPEQAIRPDHDAHFATAEIGTLDPEELLIFVDLDVMRDMEAHATSNTRVELGGVMLGKQLVDEDGRPFVLITDSLRAEHYEATKGSFKFTHETWSQISRQRAEFRPDLEMVGWYHTHPGWSVFLSGMDLFICNHFFNRPLDVALVIDPCEQDRGWFQWTESDPPQTHRTAGFVLMTGRYRRDELDYFARIYNREPDMNLDPRYSSTAGGSASVQVLDGRKSTMELAVIGMLAMQFLFLIVLAGYLMMPSGDNDQVAELKSQIEQMESSQQASVRQQAQQEVLDSVVASLSGDQQLAQKMVKLQEQENLLRTSLQGQLAINDKMLQNQSKLQGDLKEASELLAKTEGQLERTQKKLQESSKEIEELKEAGGGENTSQPLAWYWWVSGGIAVLGIGGYSGYYLGRSHAADDWDSSPRTSVGGLESGTSRVDEAAQPTEPAEAKSGREPMIFTDEKR